MIQFEQMAEDSGDLNLEWYDSEDFSNNSDFSSLLMEASQWKKPAHLQLTGRAEKDHEKV